MKLIIWFVVGILTWYIYGNINMMVNNHTVRINTMIDLTAWPFRQDKVEIGCHSQFPMRKECMESIVRPCTSTRSPHQVQWAWAKWKDMDFILTVDAESRWDHQAVWDSWRAYGYCQIRWDFNKWWYDRYISMETWQERLTECHRMYSEWKKKGIVANRLYGYRVRHLNKSNIKCYE